MEKGEAKGAEKEKRETMLRMKNAFSPEQIALAMGLPVKKIQEILNSYQATSAN